MIDKLITYWPDGTNRIAQLRANQRPIIHKEIQVNGNLYLACSTTNVYISSERCRVVAHHHSDSWSYRRANFVSLTVYYRYVKGNTVYWYTGHEMTDETDCETYLQIRQARITEKMPDINERIESIIDSATDRL